MDDSFFGFDTTVPDDDGGGGQIAEPPEEEYDALNDETFGSAINGDWEEAHETMVRLGGNGERIRKRGEGLDSADGNFAKYTSNGAFKHLLSSAPSSSGSTPAPANAELRSMRNFGDSDLELNLSSMKLDDVDVSTFGDNDTSSNRINLDTAVWMSQPFRHASETMNAPSSQPNFQHFQNSMHGQSQTLPQMKPMQETNDNFGLPHMPTMAPKISTLEDIERNLIIQQAIPKYPQQQHQQPIRPQQPPQPIDHKMFDIMAKRHHASTPTQQHQQHQQQQQQQLQKQQQQQMQHKAPPGFMSTPQASPPRPNIGYPGPVPLPGLMPTPPQPHQLNGLSGNRAPPGFIYPPGLQQNLPQHPLLNQHGALPPNFPLGGNQRPLPSPHLPTALNNFAMHPSFNAMRAAGMHPAAYLQPSQPPRLPPHPLQAANNLLNQQSNSMYNMFNMRLVQEIQQNHPLLQNAAVARQQQQHSRAGSVAGDRQKHQQQQQHNRRPDGNANGANGNLPQLEYDEYANLMSTRDKHWLIGIQLSQLNTDTPYIDDYYYTVHKERKAMQNGQMRHSQAHKDNQLNHPLTQPRGHAQLILVQLGNKNGARNGQHRERRNSESTSTSNMSGVANTSGSNLLPNYIFSPLKFENSLGKLQYGSVTAPRKIIDADIMGSEQGAADADAGLPSAEQANTKQTTGNAILPVVTEVTPSSMRKSRHILLHIETLYRFLLKLEDLENPEVMATIVLKKKKESERIAVLEQLEMAHKTPEERASEAVNPQPTNPVLKNKFNYEIEPRDALVGKLKAGLTFDKVVSMMNIRKGKILLRRIMPFIADQSMRWLVWTGIFCSLQNVVKKDRDDIDGTLSALYPEFKKHIHDTDFEAIVNISSAITLNDKKLTGIFSSRFGILSLVCLILRAETIYISNTDSTLSEDNKEKWRNFLAQVATWLNRTMQNQIISAAFESDAIQPLMNHFARFKDLKLDALLALITEAKQQID